MRSVTSKAPSPCRSCSPSPAPPRVSRCRARLPSAAPGRRRRTPRLRRRGQLWAAATRHAKPLRTLHLAEHAVDGPNAAVAHHRDAQHHLRGGRASGHAEQRTRSSVSVCAADAAAAQQPFGAGSAAGLAVKRAGGERARASGMAAALRVASGRARPTRRTLQAGVDGSTRDACDTEIGGATRDARHVSRRTRPRGRRRELLVVARCAAECATRSEADAVHACCCRVLHAPPRQLRRRLSVARSGAARTAAVRQTARTAACASTQAARGCCGCRREARPRPPQLRQWQPASP